VNQRHSLSKNVFYFKPKIVFIYLLNSWGLLSTSIVLPTCTLNINQLKNWTFVWLKNIFSAKNLVFTAFFFSAKTETTTLLFLSFLILPVSLSQSHDFKETSSLQFSQFSLPPQLKFNSPFASQRSWNNFDFLVKAIFLLLKL
jgi:hypothetical protein